MKLYVFFGALVVLCCAARQATAYDCPMTDPPVTCPRDSASSCFNFCLHARGEQHSTSTEYLCPGTNINCPYPNPTRCVHWCMNQS